MKGWNQPDDRAEGETWGVRRMPSYTISLLTGLPTRTTEPLENDQEGPTNSACRLLLCVLFHGPCPHGDYGNHDLQSAQQPETNDDTLRGRLGGILPCCQQQHAEEQ